MNIYVYIYICVCVCARAFVTGSGSPSRLACARRAVPPIVSPEVECGARAVICACVWVGVCAMPGYASPPLQPFPTPPGRRRVRDVPEVGRDGGRGVTSRGAVSG